MAGESSCRAYSRNGLDGNGHGAAMILSVANIASFSDVRLSTRSVGRRQLAGTSPTPTMATCDMPDTEAATAPEATARTRTMSKI